MSSPSPKQHSKAELERGIRHLGYEFEVMMAMPVLIRSADEEGNWALGTAALEGFLVHARNYTEFFFGRRRQERMHYRDFLPAWTLPVSPEATSLRERIGPLNAHLAHLFWERVIRPSPPWPYPTIADEVLSVFGAFAVALATNDPGLGAIVKQYVVQGVRSLNPFEP